MAVFLFTYHGYGTWMPDREEGFARRGTGMLPPNREYMLMYQRDIKNAPADFDEPRQLALIAECQSAAERQRFRLHHVATEPTHLHALLSWKDDRPWMKMRTGLKSSLSRRLNSDFERRQWFGDYASRRHVEDQDHFDYLVHVYLPEHGGWKWSETKGVYR
jgi:REP element-mobilizing transposase RayT